MKRSTGVTVVAVLAIIGSALTLLMGLLMGVIFLFVPIPVQQSPASPVFLKGVLVMSSLMYLIPAIWGIITSVGLFRLRNWARISIIVFSVLLGLSSCFVTLTLLIMPTPPSSDHSMQTGMFAARLIVGLFSAGFLAIGVWWVVFFTRPSVKEQFARPETSRDANDATRDALSAPKSKAAARPLSITIIAWLMLVGCAFMPLALFLHSPAIVFTAIVGGWKATLLYFVYAAVNLAIAIGLLRLRPYARLGAITLYLLGALNLIVFYLAPGGKDRVLVLLAQQTSMFPWTASAPNPAAYLADSRPVLILGMVVGIVAMAVPLYFLVTSKEAFERVEGGV